MSEIRLAFFHGIDFNVLLQHARSREWVAETASRYPVPGTDAHEADAYFFSWRLGDEGAVRFVDDEVTEVQYIIIRGGGAISESVTLATEFSVLGYADCLEALSGEVADEMRERFLETLGVIAPRDYHMGVFRAVSAGLDGDNSAIRGAAVSASLHLLWPEFRAPLQRVAALDPDPNNRAIASNVLYALP